MNTSQRSNFEEHGINESVDLDELNNVLRADAIKTKAAQAYARILEEERHDESKVDSQKVKEFEEYVRKIYASHIKTKGHLINRIFDENVINSAVKGFLMREMALAIKHVIPEYRNKQLLKIMNNLDLWIRDANKIRVATKAGNKIHSSELGGHLKFRWYIQNLPEDHKKQTDFLKNRIESADKTLENRKGEWLELQQKRQEPEPEQVIVTVSEEQKEVN